MAMCKCEGEIGESESKETKSKSGVNARSESVSESV